MRFAGMSGIRIIQEDMKKLYNKLKMFLDGVTHLMRYKLHKVFT